MMMAAMMTTGAHAAPAEPLANSTESAQFSPVPETVKKPKLRFKNKGPTCLCADGLSEKDILEQQLLLKSNQRESK